MKWAHEAAPAVIPLHPRLKHSAAEGERTWPDYERCVAGAPPSKEGDGTDRSMADFFWCMLAAERGSNVKGKPTNCWTSARRRRSGHSSATGDALITVQIVAGAAVRGKQMGRG